jgi:hypothetical protein
MYFKIGAAPPAIGMSRQNCFLEGFLFSECSYGLVSINQARTFPYMPTWITISEFYLQHKCHKSSVVVGKSFWNQTGFNPELTPNQG